MTTDEKSENFEIIIPIWNRCKPNHQCNRGVKYCKHLWRTISINDNISLCPSNSPFSAALVIVRAYTLPVWHIIKLLKTVSSKITHQVSTVSILSIFHNVVNGLLTEKYIMSRHLQVLAKIYL